MVALPAEHAALVRDERCSTPCGIRDGCTSRSQIISSGIVNCSTPCGIRDGCTPRSAVASPRGRPPAQRLAASEMVAPMKPRVRVGLVQTCSTPCGIRDGCTGLGDRGLELEELLNALRHQRWLHRHSDLPGDRSVSCSTPCGIRDGCTSRAACAVPRPVLLNALRHQRWLHDGLCTDVHIHDNCSTPCGIRDGCTPGPVAVEPGRRPTAQRLAASEMVARVWGLDYRRWFLCSTPCGIRDGCTRPCRPVRWWRGAAQRLAASEMVARGFHRLELRLSVLLNALRHQRWLHVGHPGSEQEQRLLLNALRHQRWLHDCRSGTIARYLRLLNALRHQRWLHTVGREGDGHSGKSAQRLAASEMVALDALRQALGTTNTCSTPCGIRDGCTRCSARAQSVNCSAQRLAASEMVARVDYLYVFTADTTAQRLAASEMVARRPSSGGPYPVVFCSTPCGIRDGCTGV